MGTGINFHGATSTIAPPPGHEDTVASLHLFRSRGGDNVSCHELAADEYEEIARTGRVYVACASGAVFYPIFVGSEESVRALVANCGHTFARTPDALQPPSRSAIAFRISSEVLELARSVDGGLECRVDGPSRVMVHVVPGDVEGVQATALPIDVATVRELVDEISTFLGADDRNTASSCGVLDKLAPVLEWLEEADVAGGAPVPTRKHECTACDLPWCGGECGA